MPSLPCLRWIVAVLLVAAGVSAGAQQQRNNGDPTMLGASRIALDERWSFHMGDDPGWANPGLDDSGWERIAEDRGWGVQGHFAEDGFAWYRYHINVRSPKQGEELWLFLPHVESAYEVFWNGRLVGRYGKMPPSARWPTGR